MLSKRQIQRLAQNACIKGIRYYKQRMHEDVDVLSGEEKRLIAEEMERIIEEIKVGEYVRTDKGIIEKWVRGISKVLFITTYGELKNHSFEIIDLIEVGDYVNGKKVLRINDYGDFKRADFNLDYDDGDAVYNDDIKTILTHEMYNQNCYKVGVENE